MDYILNGKAHGDVASLLLATGFNTNSLRPYSLPTGRTNQFGLPEYAGTYLTVNQGDKLVPKQVSNAQALMRREDWIAIDRAVIQSAKARTRLVSELRSRGLTYNVPGAMGKTVLQSQSTGDISAAEISMNGVRESRRDRPVYDLTNLPLPIIHKDFSFFLRELEASRNGGSPLDTTMSELASRKVMETVEQLALGSLPAYKYAGGYIYGLINYPGRMTKTLTLPTAVGWTGATLLGELLAMKEQSKQQFHFGPWILFTSPAMSFTMPITTRRVATILTPPFASASRRCRT